VLLLDAVWRGLQRCPLAGTGLRAFLNPTQVHFIRLLLTYLYPHVPAPASMSVTATYKAGQTIEVHFFISTNHYGRIEFRLCPLTATSSSDCTKLQRWV
jgi:hypothetical protein